MLCGVYTSNTCLNEMVSITNAIAPLCILLWTSCTNVPAAAFTLPLLRLGSLGSIGQNRNATARSNVTLFRGLRSVSLVAHDPPCSTDLTRWTRQLPPDPSLFEAPDAHSTIVRLYGYGESLGHFDTNSIVIAHAIEDAGRHSPPSHIKWSSQCYSVHNVPVQLWVKRNWGRGWYGESMTWGEWGAAAKVLLNFTRDWEFVALNFDVINAVDNVDIAFGQLRRI